MTPGILLALGKEWKRKYSSNHDSIQRGCGFEPECFCSRMTLACKTDGKASIAEQMSRRASSKS